MSAEPLINWVRLREELRKKKESGAPPPWTSDPILSQFRFCNVRRADDRVSRWLRQNVLTKQNLSVSLPQFIMFTALCRWINWPPTIAKIMQEGLFPSPNIDWQKVVRVMDSYKEEGNKLFTGAYMINAKGCQKGQTKAWFVVQIPILVGIGSALLRIEKALYTGLRQEVWSTLKDQRNGWGAGFMAGQVVDDWSWTPLLSNAKDTTTWAPMGPGSIRGHNRLLGLPLRKRPKEKDWCVQLQAWRQDIIAALGSEYEDLSLMDVQNSLCETDKYIRTINGEGKPRSVYRPETAY